MGLNQGKQLPGIFRRIRLELAREPGHPEGDPDTGYILLAPLHRDGRLDVDSARTFRDDCTVVRFRAGADNDNGYLRRRPGGFWAFHYDLPDGEEDDDPAFKLGEHRFIVGEYVTIIENDGAHTYRVADVQPL
jgi:hypothetical protein